MRRPQPKRPDYFRISILPATGRIVRILAAEQGVSIKDLIERLVHDEAKRMAEMAEHSYPASEVPDRP